MIPVGFLTVSLLTACSGNKDAGGAAPSGGGPITSAGQNPTDTGVAAGQAGHEIEEVKATIKKMGEQKDLAGIAPYLTNRTAAAFGTVMSIIPMMIVSFGEMGQKMGSELGKALGGKPAEPAKPAEDKVFAEIKTDMEALSKKYGLDKKDGKPSDLEAHGREFFLEVAKIIDKMGKSDKLKGQGEAPKPSEITKKVEDAEFTVVSPTEVKVVPKDKKDQPAKFVLEEGTWRLDAGGIEDMKKEMSKAGPGGPGGMQMGGVPTPSPVPSGAAKP